MFISPLNAKFPSLSYFKSEFFLTQESIKQLPGPKSLLYIFALSVLWFITVILEIPPIFKIQTGVLIRFFETSN